MDKKPIRYHHCMILEKYKLLSFESFGDLCFLKLIFKCINDLAPEPLCSFVHKQNSSRATRGSVHKNCILPRCRTSFGQSSFSYKAAKMWNLLPSELKTITEFNIFTIRLKSWLKTKQTCTHF